MTDLELHRLMPEKFEVIYFGESGSSPGLHHITDCISGVAGHFWSTAPADVGYDHGVVLEIRKMKAIFRPRVQGQFLRSSIEGPDQRFFHTSSFQASFGVSNKSAFLAAHLKS